MDSNRILPEDPNEAISDSLIRAIRRYDAEIQSILSAENFATGVRNIFRHVKDNEGISALRKIVKESLHFGFHENGDALAKEIKDVVEARKLRVPDGGDPLTKKVFDYLEDRLKYMEKRQRRSPSDLTDQYKVLLVGDGWARRADPDNPTVKKVTLSLILLQ